MGSPVNLRDRKQAGQKGRNLRGKSKGLRGSCSSRREGIEYEQRKVRGAVEVSAERRQKGQGNPRYAGAGTEIPRLSLSLSLSLCVRETRSMSLGRDGKGTHSKQYALP